MPRPPVQCTLRASLQVKLKGLQLEIVVRGRCDNHDYARRDKLGAVKPRQRSPYDTFVCLQIREGEREGSDRQQPVLIHMRFADLLPRAICIRTSDVPEKASIVLPS